MTIGFLVNPDLTNRKISFDLQQAQEFLGGVENERVAVAFQEEGTLYAAIHNPQARQQGAEPNPVASLARNEAATGDSRFLTDPTSAICGPVIFVGATGLNISDAEIEKVEQGIRAVKAYRQDNPSEYSYWRAAVINLGTLE